MIKRTIVTKSIAVLISSLSLIINQVDGQTFKQQFQDLVSKNDTTGQQQLLEKWGKTDSHDSELFVAYFNYYVLKSKNEVITLGQNPKGKDALQIMSQDTTQTEPVGFIYGNSYYNPNLLSKGFDWIDKGIEKYPNRLDMRFGKIYIFGQIEDFENFTKEIVKTIDYSSLNNIKWTWSDNKPLDNPKDFMLGAIQDYQVQLYNTEKNDLLNNMKRIAETVLKYYPDHIESLSNLSIVFMLKKQYDTALLPLLRAEKINPTDYVVLSNIAQAYKLKGDTKNAIKYYELTLKHGDDQAKKYAQGQIDQLKKK